MGYDSCVVIANHQVLFPCSPFLLSANSFFPHPHKHHSMETDNRADFASSQTFWDHLFIFVIGAKCCPRIFMKNSLFWIPIVNVIYLLLGAVSFPLPHRQPRTQAPSLMHTAFLHTQCRSHTVHELCSRGAILRFPCTEDKGAKRRTTPTSSKSSKTWASIAAFRLSSSPKEHGSGTQSRKRTRAHQRRREKGHGRDRAIGFSHITSVLGSCTRPFLLLSTHPKTMHTGSGTARRVQNRRLQDRERRTSANRPSSH